ncbi:MAG: hypothetical protein Ta2B_20390 [Termitinemataceae bacterium]|nr:MAG: hypothetical protein Ta2B_20390 [Termitinemataceae bacterium]
MGKKVFDDDTKKADNTEELTNQIPPRPTKHGVLYIMIDGSMICTREIYVTIFSLMQYRYWISIILRNMCTMQAKSYLMAIVKNMSHEQKT